jgi:type IV secretory pathway VirB2 component (pilin)
MRATKLDLCGALISRAASTLFLVAMLTTPALASGTGMPWETPLQNALDSITGPVLKAVAIIAIITGALMLALGEGGGALRRFGGILFGIAIAFAAGQWGMTFFGFAGGAGF